MGRNARKRISYVLPLANSAGGHRLGVNGLAVDPDSSILYSGGRDGVICAWDLNLDLKYDSSDHQFSLLSDSEPNSAPPSTIFRQQVQAHTHWINDIVLAQSNQALVSASSDITVKLWRPNAQDALPPQTIGLHSDYVKCLASPGPHADWVASGGLDRKICLWDLNDHGKKLEISVGEDDNTAKGSVYALAVTHSILASGGPESIVRVWDPRSGKRITKFVGHTDNIRDVLVTQDGDTILTASSDQTVKVWSMTAGRCMYTLTMHNDSVWSLYSNHPQLSVFYSSDRSGWVAKTDVRNCAEMDEGLSVAICQEHEGVNKVVNAGNYVWTSTSNSSINRWVDVNTEADIQLPEGYNRVHRASIVTTRSKQQSPPPAASSSPNGTNEKIPLRSVLRLSHAAPYHRYQADSDAVTMYSVATSRKASASDALAEVEAAGGLAPVRNQPDFSIEGQNGLIKHVLLSDRRRVLTLDTAGEVMLWDLVQCIPIKSFGKRHLEDVTPEVNTVETVAHWCAVDTRIGSLTCVLEENYCFDAEVYADELTLEETLEFREDQRINLGKWVLRYLFSHLIDEEVKRDETYRQQLLQGKLTTLQRNNPPLNIKIPDTTLNGWQSHTSGPASASTIRAANGSHVPLMTPGLAIGVATPAVPSMQFITSALSTTAEEGSVSEKPTVRTSMDPGSDYFSSTAPHAQTTNTGTTPNTEEAQPSQATEPRDDALPQSPTEPEKAAQTKEGTWGKKFRMNFGMKKLTRTQTTETNKPAPVDEKSEDSDSRSSKTEDKVFEDNLAGVIQRLRHNYDELLSEGATNVVSGITPSLPNETPVVKPPLATTILIQEDRPDSGGVADLFEGKVGSLGQQADLIEKVGPHWLGDVLLKNQIPLKDIVKVSFILEPYQNLLPPVATDGNNRLNANRMLRARKILAYVSEKIESQPSEPGPDDLKPEEYMELYCQNQLIPPTMTLATIRAHVWRGGGDVIMYYKANGRKEIIQVSPPQPASEESEPASGEGSERKISTEAETEAEVEN